MSATVERSFRDGSRVGALIQRISRLYSGGLRRAINLVEEVSHRIMGDTYSRVRLESVLLPGNNLNRVREWGKERRFFIDDASKTKLITMLKQVAPNAATLVIEETDRICNHVFDLLGSGPTPLGKKIDWHRDFKTGHCWNPKTYYKRIRPAPYPGGYDIKVPWELSRCQHFLRLGQAYWITGDEKYSREFVAQVEDWIANNPWPWGVNWACTMDVAIRVVNLLWGYSFFRESPSLPAEFRLAFYKSLLVHGRHIWRNLENRGSVNTNHYLADLVGLIYLGILCPEFEEAAKWREFGLRELWQEMFKQVYPDGVSFEASIAYHRLATELFLSPVLLCRLNDIPVPDQVMARLEKMLEFIMYYIKPDGTVPMVGDADNGRLHRLAVWTESEREWIDHRYLLGVGAAVFGRYDFARAAGSEWQEAVWLCGPEGAALRAPAGPMDQLGSRKFPAAQLYILRNANAHLLVEAGQVGSGGLGAHNHYNSLGFELWLAGRLLIADPGTYTYSADWNARETFRALRSHNTLEADATPFNGVAAKAAPHDLFRLNWRGSCSELAWKSDPLGDFLCLKRQEPEFQHVRRIRFGRSEPIFEFDDVLYSARPRRYVLRLHLGADINAESSSGSPEQVAFFDRNHHSLAYLRLLTNDWQVALEEGQLSPSYGRRGRGQVLVFRSPATKEILLRYAFFQNLARRQLGKAHIETALTS